MATLGKGITLGATELVTNTKLHNLIDLGTVSGITDADLSGSANIGNDKLAALTSATKVSGSSLYNLTSTPNGIPAQALSNMASLSTTAGFIPRTAFVTSLGSGGTIRWNGSNAWYASQT
jgi:hypothetical protein